MRRGADAALCRGLGGDDVGGEGEEVSHNIFPDEGWKGKRPF